MVAIHASNRTLVGSRDAMVPGLMARYIAVETAIGAGVNVAIAMSITFAKTDPSIVASVHEILMDALPLMFMSAFMGALVPSALTSLRHRNGKLQVRGDAPSARRIVSIALGLAAFSMVPGVVLAGAVFRVSRETGSEGLR